MSFVIINQVVIAIVLITLIVSQVTFDSRIVILEVLKIKEVVFTIAITEPKFVEFIDVIIEAFLNYQRA